MLNHNNKRVLIPGDCDYKVMNKTFIHYDYDLLLVSHHGAKIGKPPKATQNESLAIICCSDKYDNPDNETIETLKELGYQQIIKFKNMSRSPATLNSFLFNSSIKYLLILFIHQLMLIKYIEYSIIMKRIA